MGAPQSYLCIFFILFLIEFRNERKGEKVSNIGIQKNCPQQKIAGFKRFGPICIIIKWFFFCKQFGHIRCNRV